ncbi:hypothetical protein [Hoeflea ulvae]|uniref:Uncharacterized protein n=1 Tax=Hoeflea ulvae TaxID=2983764 RepID=A0ABT3YK02_9HYPH|nr:hypothetical protein [Hoeflea ulvae]MCY0096232.1 hypothetical protein [Hoeflea ulvae]
MALGLQGFGAAVAGEAAAWSFKLHPHPEVQDLTLSERRLRDSIDFERYPHIYPACLDQVDVDYAIYQGRYPAFSRQGEPAENLRAWKRHIVRQLYPGFSICVAGLPAYALQFHEAELEEVGIVFCGRFSGQAKSPIDMFFQAQIREALDFAVDGNRGVAFGVLLYSPARSAVRLNPDVEYYFRKSFENDDDYLPRDWDSSHLIDQLTDQRKAFVEDAVKRRDLQAVLDTTADCAAG